MGAVHSTPRGIRYIAIVAVVALSAIRCDQPAAPSRHRESWISVFCSPLLVGSGVGCRGYDTSQHDITDVATWIATPESLGTFTAPGVFAPTAHGEVAITIQYGGKTSPYSIVFLVDAIVRARLLLDAYFSVMEMDGTTPIRDVTVLLTSGYRAGSSCVTLVGGGCTIPLVLTGEDFEGHASKPDYVTTTFVRQKGEPGSELPFPIIRLPRSQ